MEETKSQSRKEGHELTCALVQGRTSNCCGGVPTVMDSEDHVPAFPCQELPVKINGAGVGVMKGAL
jgi:hypothetical protein